MRIYSRRYARKVFPAALLAGTLLVALVPARYVLPFKTLSWDVASPALRAFTFVGNLFGGITDRLKDLASSRPGRAELEARIVELEARVAVLSARADHLRKQLIALAAPGGAEPSNAPRLIADVVGKRDVYPALHSYRAPVVARDAALWPRSVVVNVGARKGVKPNMPAVWAGALVGMTTAVGRFTAQVRLVTDPNFRVWVLDARDEDIEGIVEGTGSRLLDLRYVPLTDPLCEGDFIITSGFAELYPYGVLVGKVVSVEEAPDGFFWQARVEPSCDLRRLRGLLLVDTGSLGSE